MNSKPVLVEDDDTDDLVALQLRYRFSEHEFRGLVWASLSKAGWTYRKQLYFPPQNEVDGGSLVPSMNAIQVAEFLDLCAIPNIYGNFQFSTDCNQNDAILRKNNSGRSKYIAIAQSLRNDALFHMLQLLKRQGKQRESITCLKNETISFARVRRDTQSRDSSKECLNRQKRDKIVSYTSLERGTHLYLHKKVKAPRSKRKLIDAIIPKIDFDHLASPTLSSCTCLMEKYSLHDVVEIEKHYAVDFPEWRYLLSTSHSLLVYGVGSKFDLLESFATMELNKEGYTLILKGFDSTITGILDLLVKLFLDGVDPELVEMGNDYDLQNVSGICLRPRVGSILFDRVIAVARALAKVVAATLVPIFIIVHNLESLSERTAQACLWALVANSQAPNGLATIRLVCSIDHVDASRIVWDSDSFLNFRWIWKEIHTHRPYVYEFPLLGDEGLVTKHQKTKIYKKNAIVQQSVRFLDVLGSLPPRTSEIAQILAKLQLELAPKCSTNEDASAETWVDFKKFRLACKSKFAVSTDEELRKLMHELIDHRLIQRKSEGSAEYVKIPFDAEKLKEIISYKR